jgi:hypothetical protein
MNWHKAVCIIVLLAGPTVFAQSSSQKSFEKLKSLAGSWEGKGSNGQSVRESYRLTANGSALMSEIEGEHNMISMFHLDGDRLLMTHYCAAGNQPRMKALSSGNGSSVVFDFLDATNLANPEVGHMHRAVFTILDTDHLTEEWVWKQNGKETKERFELQRTK